MFERLKSDSAEECDENESMDRETAKGILCSGEIAGEIADVFNDEETTSFLVCVSVDQLRELSKLECYQDGHRYKDALKFAERWESKVNCHVVVTDCEDYFCVRLNDVTATDITNGMVRDFATRFRTDVHAEFDPLAEEHDEPVLRALPI